VRDQRAGIGVYKFVQLYHFLKVWKETIKAPEDKPAWMPEKINKPNVEKACIEKLDKI
jgi:hypothetical protein